MRPVENGATMEACGRTGAHPELEAAGALCRLGSKGVGSLGFRVGLGLRLGLKGLGSLGCTV